MRTIYKYLVPPISEFQLETPKHSQFKHAGLQNDVIFMWFEVDTDQPVEARTFHIVGTGHVVPQDAVYVGTVQQPPFVWHIYEPRA